MTTLTFSLPDSLKEYVEAQVASGAFPTVGLFLCKLIEDANAQEEALRAVMLDKQALEAELVEGLNSGPPIEATPEFWAERRRKLDERLAGNQHK